MHSSKINPGNSPKKGVNTKKLRLHRIIVVNFAMSNKLFSISGETTVL